MDDTAKENKSFFKSFTQNWPDIVAAFICSVVFLLWLNLLFEKFTHFGYYDWDLAMYAQATWALSQGSLHSSIFGTSFLTNHAEYIAFFIAPIYKLFPSAFTLVVLKILSFVGGSFVFYLIAKKLLGWPLGILLMLLYQFHPANAFMMIYEFHFENLAIIFIFLMYYFLQTRRFIAFLISACFATLVKENISLVVFMFGLYVLIKREPQGKGWVIAPVFLGLGFFILTMFVITPSLRTQEGIATANQYIGMYWDQSAKTAGLTQTIWHNVCARWHTFISPLNQRYMADLFLSLSILPLLSPQTLALGIPIFLQHFLSTAPTNHTLYYHYAATAVVFIFLSTAVSLRWLRGKLRPLFYFLIILLTMGAYSLQIKKCFPQYQERLILLYDRLDPVRQRMFEKIPPQASVVASFDFLANLANRQQIFSFHNVWQNYATFTGKTPFILPANLTHALIDWNCIWLWNDLLNSKNEQVVTYLKQINNFYFSHSWNSINAVEEITLLSIEKTDSEKFSLVENSQIPFAQDDAKPLAIEIANQIKLLDLKVVQPSPERNNILPFTFFWQSKTTTKDLIAIDIILLKDKKIIEQREHPIGYIFNTTALWKEGQYVKENYNLLLSSTLKPGQYVLDIAFFNIKSHKYLPIVSNGQKSDNLTVSISIK